MVWDLKVTQKSSKETHSKVKTEEKGNYFCLVQFSLASPTAGFSFSTEFMTIVPKCNRIK